MADNDRSPMEQAALALYYHAAEMIKAGKTREEIERDLIHNKGIKPQTARNMLDKLDVSRVNVTRQAGYQNLTTAGLVLMAALLLLTGILTGQPATGIVQVIALTLLFASIFVGARGFMQVMDL